MKKTILALFLFIITSSFLFAQGGQLKYGKVSEEEIAIKTNSEDAEFSAIILSDYGEIDISRGILTIHRHTRIKILNTNGIQEANIVIPYFVKENTEKIVNIKAQTLNVDEKGKIKKIPVNKKEIFTSDPNENWKEKRFTFPDVKPGSIIEYQYLKKSERFFSLEPWYFQNELPTLKSNLKVKIAGDLDFRLVYNGNRLLNKYGNAVHENKWSLENLPPLKEEPYCPNPQDYVESIQFQLAGYKKYNDLGQVEDVELMTTWEKLASDLLNDTDLRWVLNTKKKSKEIVQQIISEGDNEKTKIKKIYRWVQQNLSWNRKYRLFPERNFKEIIKDGNASSGEINLVLVRLLKSAGLDANPLIISTKRHGLITKVYPLIHQFNHSLAQVNLNGKDILMDATSSFRPFDLLAKNDLNPYGYLVNKKEPRWIDIPTTKKTRTIVVTDLSIKENKMIYKIDFSFFKHEAADQRWYLASENGGVSYVKKFLVNLDETSEIELDSFSVKNKIELEKPFGVSCYFSQTIEDGLNNEVIYLSPFLIKHFAKNPFNNPIRYLPVDFGVPFKEKYIFNLRLPEGYELAEVPEDIRLTTPENHCNYNFFFQEKFGHIQLSSELVLSKPLISPSHYSSLRELFSQLMSKQEVQLVLKKK